MLLLQMIVACALGQNSGAESPRPANGSSWDPLARPTQVHGQPTPTPYPAPTVPAVPSLAEGAGFQEYLENGTRGLFESDREFEGFTGPLSDPIQAKDARSLTEARLQFINNWGRPGTPVLGKGSYQVYALQLRLALTDRLQIFADKDGIVRFSPEGGRSVTGLANINAGAKYVFVRDVENQFLLSGVIQYEAPTGYANIYQNQGSGLLGIFAVVAKEFGDDWHFVTQFGQNIALQNQQNGYFFTHAHIDRRFGRFVPLYEVNWFYYNQPGKFLPPIGLEGGGLVNLGTSGMSGHNIVTSTIGGKFTLSDHCELGVGYQFAMQKEKSLYGDTLLAQLIWRY